MAEVPIDFSEILVGSLGEMIRKVGDGVAYAQTKLDEASLQAQKALPEDLAAIGYQVTWYQMPEVVAELKLAVHFEATQGAGGAKKKGIFVSPFNAKYQSAFAYKAEGASTLRFRIVPVPPAGVQGAE